MNLSRETAEAEIVKRVKMLDAIRAGAAPDAIQIARIEAEIQELKKVTGPRHIVGASDARHVKAPIHTETGAGSHEDFDAWNESRES